MYSSKIVAICVPNYICCHVCFPYLGLCSFVIEERTRRKQLDFTRPVGSHSAKNAQKNNFYPFAYKVSFPGQNKTADLLKVQINVEVDILWWRSFLSSVVVDEADAKVSVEDYMES